MENIRLLFRFCSSVMSIPIYLFGYTITLWQVAVFGFVVFIVGSFIFRMFD